MKRTANKSLLLAAALTGVLLSGCTVQQGPQNAPTAPQSIELPADSVEELALVVTTSNIAKLESYRNLKSVDLTGSTCYAEMDAYVSRHPEVRVTYTVDLGGKAVPYDTEDVTLLENEYTPDVLMQNVRWLRNLKTLNLPGDLITADHLKQLRMKVPGLHINYSVNVAGILCDGNSESLDLSSLTSASVPLAVAELPKLTQLRTVELMNSAGYSSLTIDDVAALEAAAPEASFHYTFELFGQIVSTTDKEVYYQNVNIGGQEGAENTLRRALTIMKGCKRFVLDKCNFANETLAQIREEFRGQTKVVWRVWFSTDGSSLTDREMLRVTFHLTDSNCHDLVYCEDVKYLDMGHNESLYTVDFVSGMPNLVAVIVSGAPISDLSPFAGCTKLEMLEVAFCGYVKDISPLAECASLERLNIGFTKVKDLSVLDDKNIVILVDTNTGVSNAERKRFEELHPQCLVQHSGAQPYGHPWRYLSDKLTYNEYYAMLREVFDYENGTNTHF